MSFFLRKTEKGTEKDEIDRQEGIDDMDTLIEERKTLKPESIEGKAAEEVEEHYDGSTMNDVYGDYDSVRKSREVIYIPVHFVETRKYLQRVRDLKRHIQLIEDRIGYRRDAGLDTESLESEMEDLRQELKKTVAEVADEIGKLDDINQQVVMTKRYIDTMSWDEIAETADFKMRTVQKCHGRALPNMEKILLEDGLIELEEKDEFKTDLCDLPD